MSDIASTSTSVPLVRKSRGANPSTDYKSLFLKSKDKFDRVSTEHTDLKANVVKATAKHQKLREELDYLLDAVAAKREQRAQVEQSRREHALELEREAAAEAARRRANPISKRDLERERDAYEIRSMTRGFEGGEEYRPYPARYAEPSYHAFGSGITRGFRESTPPLATSSAIKRPRPTSVERELLETDEGYHSKRARND
uniref:Uncharacterized protein n=1 Tax=Kalmanozyma brasiliensis (strain GHG001) TaxID=1365824 RepID=V5E556_KALBG